MKWVFGEALRNVGAGTTRALRYASTLAIILFVCAAADLLAVNALIQRAQEYQESGASIITVEAPGLVDGASCDALARIPGVRAAGAIQQNDDSLTPEALPDGSIASFRVSTGGARLFRVEDDTGAAGVLLSEDVLDTLGVATGAALNTLQGDVQVRGSFPWPQDGRRPGYSYAALSPDPSSEPFDECWVDAWPVPRNLSEVIHTTLNPDPTGQIKVITSQVNTTKGSTFDGGRSFDERITKYAPYAAVFAGFVLGFVAIRSRRLELAAAQHVGVSRWQQLVQTFTETFVWVAVASMTTAGAVAVLIASGTNADRVPLALVAAHAAVPGLVSALLGGLAASVSIREAHLFIYFKAR